MLLADRGGICMSIVWTHIPALGTTVISSLVACGHYTDAEAQLGATTAADSIGVSEQTHFPTKALNSSQSKAPTSSSSPLSSPSTTPESENTDVQPARFLGGAQSSSGGIKLTTVNVF